jgi:predicted DCC family thiol-disulfide oxidoreductase YuxK
MTTMTVLYDGRCTFCQRSRRMGEALDWLKLTRWVPNTEAQGSIVVEKGGQRLIYWQAVKAIALKMPLIWLLILPALAMLPIFDPIGDRVYRWIAANRYRLGGDHCDIS